MSFYEEQILPRLVDRTMGTPRLGKHRARAMVGLSGTVLEIGFGSGLNVPYYPSEVDRILAVDPSLLGRRLASKRLAASPVPVDFCGLDGQVIPLDQGSADHALCTWTLCTIPDVQAALAEVKRVLRPGGALHFIEHGRAPDARVARWQDRINPIHRRFAGGCNLNRPIVQLLEDAGFELLETDRFYVKKTPRFLGYFTRGVARACG